MISKILFKNRFSLFFLPHLMKIKITRDILFTIFNRLNFIEKEELSREDVANYGQVQERKGQLLNLIESNLSQHPEESSQLKEIVEDWAELKIEAFQNRRSWVRAAPSKGEKG